MIPRAIWTSLKKDDGGQVEQDAEDGEQGDDESPHDVGEGVDGVGPLKLTIQGSYRVLL